MSNLKNNILDLEHPDVIKERFLTLDPLEAIEYINKLLLEFGTLSKIERELGISRKSITRRADKINYAFNKAVNKYESKDNMTLAADVILIDPKPIIAKPPRNTEVIPGNLNNTDIESLKYLIEHIEEIKNLINNSNNVNVTKNITIELPEDLSNFKTTVGLNKVVWERFDNFYNKWKQYNKKDLHSQALKEFMDKYDT